MVIVLYHDIQYIVTSLMLAMQYFELGRFLPKIYLQNREEQFQKQQ